MKFLQKILLFLFISATLHGAEDMESLLLAPQQELQKYYYELLPAELRWQLLQMTGPDIPLMGAIGKQLFEHAYASTLSSITVNVDHENLLGMTFSPDGRLLATRSPFDIKLWNAADGQLIGTLTDTEIDQPITSLAFNPQINHLAACFDSGGVIIWDITTGQRVALFKANRNDRSSMIVSIAYNPQGNFLAVGSFAEIKLLDIFSEYTPIRTLPDSSFVTSMAFNSRGFLLIGNSLYDNQAIKIWNLNTGDLNSGNRIKTFERGEDKINKIILNRLGTLLVTQSFSNKLSVWNINSGERIGGIGNAVSASFNADGTVLAVTSVNGTVSLMNTHTTFTVINLPANIINSVKSVLFHPLDNTILATASDNHAVIWKLYRHADFDLIISSPERFNFFKTILERKYLDKGDAQMRHTFQHLPEEWKEFVLRTVPIE
jgi:WD40 repeat protein